MTTLGKFRHLSRCSTEDGRFVILAIDHRENLRRLMDKAAPSPITDEAFTDFKQAIISTIGSTASAVLTDPDYGISHAIIQNGISGRKGLIAPVEITDYDAHPSQREIAYIPGWSVAKIKRVGGDGVKLLLPYHPDGPNGASGRQAVEKIVAECTQHDIPFFLEPIPYSLDPDKTLDNVELLQVSVENAGIFSTMGVDILKVPFPVDAKQSQDPQVWRTACDRLNEACTVPWALLSAGVSFDIFVEQAEIACKAGASGVIVGRAVWAEAVTLQDEERAQFISSTGVQRMDTLKHVCTTHAMPWSDQVMLPETGSGWYQTY